MKGYSIARRQPTVNLCLDLHISGKCLQADPYQRSRYPELKFAVELPTSPTINLELLLQAKQVPVLHSWHKTTEWLASKMESQHRKLSPQVIVQFFGSPPVFCCWGNDSVLCTGLTDQSWQTRACQKGGYLQWIKITNTIQKSALRNDKPETCLHPLICEYTPVNSRRNWRS